MKHPSDADAAHESLVEAFRELHIAEAVGCCGAGRHLVIKQGDGTYAYLHDSAVMRGGDPVATGEDRIYFARRCSKETAWDAATEDMTDAAIDAVHGPERDADGEVPPAEIQRICRGWAEEYLSNLCDEQILEI
jgi:hypothetical protein